jgi:hypothetical protein
MRTSTWAQLIAAACAQFFSIISLILVLIWAGKSEIDQVPLPRRPIRDRLLACIHPQ